MENRRFLSNKGPHIRKADSKGFSTTDMMKHVLIALIPIIVFSFIKNGILPYSEDKINFFGMLRPLLLVVFAGGLTYLFEGLFYKIVDKSNKGFKKEHMFQSMIPGVLYALAMPLYTPFWVIFIGALFAIVVGKLLFGGFGYNVFNPALLGVLFSMTAFAGVIMKSGGFLNASEIVDVVSGATPLTEIASVNVFKNPGKLLDVINHQGGLLNLFTGFSAGVLGETSAILCLFAFFYLSILKVIDWKMPVAFVGTVFIVSYITGLFYGHYNLNFALFNILTGGVMFGGVFMVTEPVTSPKDPNAKIIYAILIGVSAIMLRFLSSYPEGVGGAILFINMFAGLIDRHVSTLRIEDNKKKKIVGYSSYAVLVILLLAFIVVRVGV